jgi:hypothetical protein
MHALLASVLLVVPIPLAQVVSERPSLLGTVQDERGLPLVGATVFIYTAAPRQGIGIL